MNLHQSIFFVLFSNSNIFSRSIIENPGKWDTLISHTAPKWLLNLFIFHLWWNTDVLKHKQAQGGFPTFSEFVKFMKEQSELANLPVISSEAIEDLEDSSKAGTNSRSAYTFQVLTESQNNCCLCGGQHKLYKWQGFLDMNVERYNTVAEPHLCYFCLNSEHESSEIHV